ncbi:hypothetical protein BN8_01407 [Fibrisoma limi BUZ 3]|uniref:Uncharacterized protein n=1 Tax=Fibrisoma limi BUZ 3 TaxID=1185876 RepID=I2GET1_9BACT|nr:hypothetical protein BN8_01407 [Fibrisoma limi BUZ 3]
MLYFIFQNVVNRSARLPTAWGNQDDTYWASFGSKPADDGLLRP